MSASAWKTAEETGAFAYMPYAEVQRYSDIYEQQAIVNASAVQLFRQQTEAIAPMLTEGDANKPLAPEEMTRLLHETAVSAVDLQTLGQVLVELRDEDDKVLRQQ